MKQPELGKKIAELRKAKSLTQEELVAKCNLNVRTLQRIESGVVTPRSYTIRIIFAALEYADSLQNVPSKFAETGPVCTNRIEQLFNLFNLKTNTMRKISILSAVFIFIGISLFFISSEILAQKYTVVIDAGHGGKDLGAIVQNKAEEKDIALSLAKQLKEKTKGNNDFRFIFSRDSDNFVRLDKRINKAKESKADLFISIHINSSTSKEIAGIECYTATTSDYKAKSKNIAGLFINEFKQLRGITTQDSIKEKDFTILNDSQCPALMLNIGYLTNSNDLSYVRDLHNQRLICDKIIDAIDKIDK